MKNQSDLFQLLIISQDYKVYKEIIEQAGIPIWALARESHAALAVVDETLWFVFIHNCVQNNYA
jgi:hypothetical protein